MSCYIGCRSDKCIITHTNKCALLEKQKEKDNGKKG